MSVSINGNEVRPTPSYQHPLFRPEKRHIPPLPRIRAQPIQQMCVSQPQKPATTFDEILPTVNTSSEPHGQQATPHSDLPTTLHRDPSPSEQDSKPKSRTARFFAHFRTSPKQSNTPTPQRIRVRSRSNQLEGDPTKPQQLLRLSQQDPASPPAGPPTDHRQQSRAQARQAKAELKETQRAERARTQWLGGVAWGFDPDAGMRRNDQVQYDDPRNRRSEKDVRRAWCTPPPLSPAIARQASDSRNNDSSSDRRTRGSSTSDEPGPSRKPRPSHPRADASKSSMSSTRSMPSGFEEVYLGVETGGPGREGQYEYGMLRSRQQQQTGVIGPEQKIAAVINAEGVSANAHAVGDGVRRGKSAIERRSR